MVVLRCQGLSSVPSLPLKHSPVKYVIRRTQIWPQLRKFNSFGLYTGNHRGISKLQSEDLKTLSILYFILKENDWLKSWLGYLGLNYFRSEILRGPTQCPGPVCDLLGKTEICYDEMSLLVSFVFQTNNNSSEKGQTASRHCLTVWEVRERSEIQNFPGQSEGFLAWDRGRWLRESGGTPERRRSPPRRTGPCWIWTCRTVWGDWRAPRHRCRGTTCRDSESPCGSTPARQWRGGAPLWR